MKITLYREVESLEDVSVMEPAEVDWPFRDLLRHGGLDLGLLETYLDRERKWHDLSYSNAELHPLYPTPFRYRSPSEGAVRQVTGIVVSSSISALAKFYLDRLETVNGDSLPPERRDPSDAARSQFLNDLEEVFEDLERSHSYSRTLHPLMMVPQAGPTERDDRWFERLKNKTVFLEREGDRYFLPHIRLGRDGVSAPNIERRTGKGRGQRRRSDPFDTLSVAWLHQDVPDLEHGSRTSERPVVYSVVPRYIEDGHCGYDWRMGAHTGHAGSVRELPIHLCETLDEHGRSVFLSPADRHPIHQTYLETSALIGAARERLTPHLSRSYAGCPEPGVRGIGGDSFNAPCVLMDCSRPMLGGRDEAQDDNRSRAFVIRDPELLAYLLQRTENQVYDPEQSARPVPAHRFQGRSEVWFAIREYASDLIEKEVRS